MKRNLITLSIMLALFSQMTQKTQAADKSNHDFDRWKKAISQFEEQDQKQKIKKNGVLFVGSSSIRLWDLNKYFPGQPVINRGFGGSEIVDSTHFADRIILKHQPKLVFLYAGDNDISRNRTAKEVASDFRKFTATIHKTLPETRIVFIAIKPSLRRWELSEKMIKANQLIAEQCAENRLLDYADVWNPMLGADGKPRPELFQSDGLHLKHEGYVVWTNAVKPFMAQE